MNNWTQRDILLAVFALLLTYIAEQITRLLIGTLAPTNNALLALFLLFLVPMLCIAVMVYWFKKRGRDVWGTAVVLVSLIFLFLFCGYHNTATTKLISLFTGHYNLEATGFGLLMAVIYCGGMLAGVGLGCLIWSYRKKYMKQ